MDVKLKEDPFFKVTTKSNVLLVLAPSDPIRANSTLSTSSNLTQKSFSFAGLPQTNSKIIPDMRSGLVDEE